MGFELRFRRAINSDIPKCAAIISLSEAWTSYGIDYEQVIDLLSKMEDEIFIAENEERLVGLRGIG